MTISVPISGGLGRGCPVREFRSRGPREEGPQANQVVRGRRERHDPIDACAATMPQLPQPADGLHPAKDLLDQFAALLADRRAVVPGRPTVNRALFDLPRDMRCDAARADGGDKAGDIKVLVATDG